MARPVKDGLDYFPLDVGIFEDEKIEAIAGEFGIKGELAVIKLLCAVYRKGYFIVWNDLTKATLLKRLPGVSKDLLDQIVIRLVTWGFFNEDLFNSAKVLTSENIQATYFEATKRRKSPKPAQYIVNANNSVPTKGVNVDINTQSKEKESKVNKNKVNTTTEDEYSIKVYSYLQNNGFGSPFGNTMGDNINFWFQELEEAGLKEQEADEWLMLGIDTAIESNRRQWNYVDGILRNRFNKQLFSKEAIEGANIQHKEFGMKKTRYGKEPIRREPIPEWLEDPEGYNARKEAELTGRSLESDDLPF